MKGPPLTCPNTVTVRRNPLQKARPTPSTAVPQIPTFPSKNLPEISSFPIDEMLSIQIPQNPLPDLSQASSTSKNLNVFLRIRPLVLVKSGDQNSKPRAKNVWPKNPAKRVAVKEKNAEDKSNEVCITVDDSQSVTLSPPLALRTSKRISSVVYQGFSYVFSADSSQGEVYEKMLSPLVEEFCRGKSGMLAALGPSGSGKTHTIFGSPGDPGMVSLALQRIFKGTTGIGSESRRSFYLSIFEIYYERGKGERVLDLSPNGGDLFMQQSTIKDLQEVIISNAAQAEFLISRAMLKRATAMTNTNSQSSRSQCIINIRSTSSKPDGKGDVAVKDAVLTIVDLAGAQREKRTGNQGSRLLENGFINNTSMIFCQCLRALLEHQKNPRNPLEKHVQNSLLTRYLRDYLEGKKRMALVLTVKSGGEDYLDTSYLLRQASPYMEIKFDKVEDPSNLVGNKRHFQTPRVEQPKRMKFSGLEAFSIEEAKSIGEENQLSTDGCLKDITLKPNAVELAKRERNHQITQNFAEAVWNVVKHYNEELKIVTDKLSSEKTRNQELEKELKELKSCCNCSRESSEAVTSSKTNTDFEYGMKLDGPKSSKVNETSLDVNSQHLRSSERGSTPLKCESTPGQDEDTLPQITLECDSPKLKTSEWNSTPNNYGFTPRQDQVVLSQINVDIDSPNVKKSELNGTSKNYDFTLSQDQDVFSQINVDVPSSDLRTSECHTIPEQGNSSGRDHQDVSTKEPLDSAPSPKKVASTAVCNNVLSRETIPNTSHKPVTIEKPKRRLMPASSILLRDISALDVEDEFEKPKGNRNGKKVAANEGEITQEKMSSRSSRTIYVGNLRGDTRMREVEDLFYKYGSIVDIDVKNPPRPPGYAFVEFEDYRDAEDAIRGRDGYNFDGYRLQVELAHGGRRPSSSVDRYSNSCGGGGSRGLSRRSDYRVLVTGLPSAASWQDLKDHMRRAGDVCFSQVFRDLGGMTGIVDYTTYNDMKYAIYKLDRSEFQNAFSRANVRVREYDSRRGYSRSRSRSPYHSRSQSPVYNHSYSGRKRSVSPRDKYTSRSPSVSPARLVSERSH